MHGACLCCHKSASQYFRFGPQKSIKAPVSVHSEASQFVRRVLHTTFPHWPMSRRLRLQLVPRGPHLLGFSAPLQSLTARSYRVSSSSEGSSSSRRASSSPSRSTKSLSQLVLAMRLFHALERHFAVPFSFVVPRSRAWPRELHRLPLGMKVHRSMQAQSKGLASALATKQQNTEQL